jgi:hypothetical protein
MRVTKRSFLRSRAASARTLRKFSSTNSGVNDHPVNRRRYTMFRKITCALVAIAALSTAALAPSSASARVWPGGYHGVRGGTFHGFGNSGPGHGFCWRPYAYICQ